MLLVLIISRSIFESRSRAQIDEASCFANRWWSWIFWLDLRWLELRMGRVVLRFHRQLARFWWFVERLQSRDPSWRSNSLPRIFHWIHRRPLFHPWIISTYLLLVWLWLMGPQPMSLPDMWSSTRCCWNWWPRIGAFQRKQSISCLHFEYHQRRRHICCWNLSSSGSGVLRSAVRVPSTHWFGYRTARLYFGQSSLLFWSLTPECIYQRLRSRNGHVLQTSFSSFRQIWMGDFQSFERRVLGIRT